VRYGENYQRLKPFNSRSFSLEFEADVKVDNVVKGFGAPECCYRRFGTGGAQGLDLNGFLTEQGA
jgi:hypothetical protein